LLLQDLALVQYDDDHSEQEDDDFSISSDEEPLSVNTSEEHCHGEAKEKSLITDFHSPEDKGSNPRKRKSAQR
jgi:hypothetical protein